MDEELTEQVRRVVVPQVIETTTFLLEGELDCLRQESALEEAMKGGAKPTLIGSHRRKLPKHALLGVTQRRFWLMVDETERADRQRLALPCIGQRNGSQVDVRRGKEADGPFALLDEWRAPEAPVLRSVRNLKATCVRRFAHGVRAEGGIAVDGDSRKVLVLLSRVPPACRDEQHAVLEHDVDDDSIDLRKAGDESAAKEPRRRERAHLENVSRKLRQLVNGRHPPDGMQGISAQHSSSFVLASCWRPRSVTGSRTRGHVNNARFFSAGRCPRLRYSSFAYSSEPSSASTCNVCSSAESASPFGSVWPSKTSSSGCWTGSLVTSSAADPSQYLLSRVSSAPSTMAAAMASAAARSPPCSRAADENVAGAGRSGSATASLAGWVTAVASSITPAVEPLRRLERSADLSGTWRK